MSSVQIRLMTTNDLEAVVDIDALHTGTAKRAHWQRILEALNESSRVGLAAHRGDALEGYVVGEIRAWEFGSPPAGWIYAVGVHPRCTRQGLGSLLVQHARSWFAARGVNSVRTMVRKEDVDLLRFFRNDGFAAGPFVELEVEL